MTDRWKCARFAKELISKTEYRSSEISPLISRNRVNLNGSKFTDLTFNLDYIRFCTFIAKYGEHWMLDHTADTYIQTTFGKKMNKACFENSMRKVLAMKSICPDLTTSIRYPQIGSGTFGYVEGITSLAPFSIHGWVGFENTRHSLALDPTWDIVYTNPKDILYFGVKFDTEFALDIIESQAKKERHSMPYLYNGGGSTLCCTDLLNGDISDYCIGEEDVEDGIKLAATIVMQYINTFENKLAYLNERK